MKEERPEDDPSNIGKTFEVIVTAMTPTSIDVKFTSGKVVTMHVADASLTPVRNVMAQPVCRSTVWI